MSEWHDCYGDDDLWEDEMVGVELAGRPVLLVRTADGLCAYADKCPHKGTPLHDGTFEDGVIKCATHNWTFDYFTGDSINPRDRHLDRYEVRINDGRIEVRWA